MAAKLRIEAELDTDGRLFVGHTLAGESAMDISAERRYGYEHRHEPLSSMTLRC